MKKNACRFILSFAVAILSLLVCLPKNSVWAATVAQDQATCYMIDTGGSTYQTNIDAGSATGYGEYLLGDTDIAPIKASAKAGFYVAGWQISFTEVVSADYQVTRKIDGRTIADNTAIYQESSFAISYETEDGQSFDVNYTISQSDLNNDGYFEQSILSTSQIVENIKVNPVYDYIYTNVDTTDFVALSNLGEYQTISNIFGNTDLVYLTSSTEEAVTVYHNAYLKTDGKYFYFGDVYADGDNYYTLNERSPKVDDGKITMQVPVQKGRYRLNQQVEYSTDIDVNTDFNLGHNIDIVGVGLTLDGETTQILKSGENNFTLTQDQYLRSTNIQINFVVTENKSHLAELSVDYDKLYIATVTPTISGATAGENEELLLNALTIEKTAYFSQIEEKKRYFVKDPVSGTNAVGFKLTANQKIVYQGYEYYDFESLSSTNSAVQSSINKNNLNLTKAIDSDFELVVNYTPILYSVDFKFVLYDTATKKFMALDGDYFVENSLKLERGQTSSEISKTTVSNNVGYNFFGFVDEQYTSNLTVNDGTTINTTIQVTINQTYPTNKTILMLFVEKEYQIKFNNLNNINLNNGVKDVYPINNLAMSVNRAGNVSTVSIDDLNAGNIDRTFAKTVKIGDKLTIVASINKGFKLLGFGLNNGAKTFDGTSFDLTLTQTLLANYDNANTDIIDIFDFEEFEKYTLTYTLNGDIGTGESKVLMADISVEYNGTVYDKSNTTDDITYVELGGEKAQIIISNLKLYEKVKLISRAKSINNDNNEPYFLFNRYTENFQTNFTLVETDPPAMLYTVQKDIEIFVVYSLPGLKLQLSIDDGTAYDLSQNLQQGTTYLTDADGNRVDFETTDLQPSKRYTLTLNNAFNFGFELLGYNYNGTVNLASSLADPYTFEFTTLSTTQIHYIVILTKQVKFKLNVNYAYNIEQTPVLKQSFEDITVSNLHLEFETDEGYYVSQAYFVNALGNKTRYEAAEYDNNYASSSYIYNFTASELEQLIGAYGVVVDDVTNLNMLVIYSLHVYRVKVSYSLVTSKGVYDNRVNFPAVTMTANGDKILYIDDAGSRTFYNIPYGANVVLTADENNEEGMSAYGWIYDIQPGFSSNLTQLTIQKLTADQNLEYKLNYNVYIVKIEQTGNTKQPIVVITDPSTGKAVDKISRFDSLSIDMNADRQNGWRFVNMYYYKNQYVVYNYNEADFATKELYIIENGQYVINTQAYDSNLTYYTKEKVQVDFSAFAKYDYNETSWKNEYKNLYVLVAGEYKRNDSSIYDDSREYYSYKQTIFEDINFQAGNYLAEVDENKVYSITFYVYYDYIDISLNIQASVSGINNLKRGDLSLLPIDYADLTFSVVSNLSQEKLLEKPYSVTINDNLVRIAVKLANINVDGQEYNLSNGVKLLQAYVGDKTTGNINIIDKGAGVYVLEFYVASMLNNNCVSENDSFEIYLTYQVINKHMELTTSIEASEFYRDTTGNTIFSMSNDQLIYGFGAGSSSSRGANKISVDFQFLGKVLVSYAFINPYQEYNQYFKITGIKLYSITTTTNAFGYITYTKGDLIKVTTAEELAKLGITNATIGSNFDYRFIDNLYIELQVQPVIKVNGDNNRFYFTFNFDNQGNGIEQNLTVGQDSSCHIEMAQILQDYLSLTYHKSITQNGVIIGYSADNAQLIDADTYLVKIEFKGYGSWAWLTSLKYDNDIYVVVSPKTIELKVNDETFSRKQVYEKEYEGKSAYNFNNVTDLLNYVYITDGNRSYPYTEANDNLRLVQSMLIAKICYLNNDTLVYSGIATKSGELFNIELSGLQINNKNFQLKKDSLLFESAIKINQKEITLSGVKVYDKVYDGTDRAEYQLDAEIKWLGIIAGDIVNSPLAKDLNLRFERDEKGNVKIGYNINVLIDASQVLKGDDADNYKIKVNGTTATIYPYSVSADIEGFGTIEVRNDKGLMVEGSETRHDLAGLIPVNAKLKIEVIYADSPEYIAIYPNISRFINRNHNFAVGYKIYLDNNNVTTKLNNNLTLVLPNVDRLTNLALVIANDSIELNYQLEKNRLVIDLSQTNYETTSFAIIQQRVLLKPWQLILIISLAVLILVIIIIVFIIVRKRKKERYSMNEKI